MVISRLGYMSVYYKTFNFAVWLKNFIMKCKRLLCGESWEDQNSMPLHKKIELYIF